MKVKYSAAGSPRPQSWTVFEELCYDSVDFPAFFAMANLTPKDVEYVAALAQLSLDEAAKARMLGDLENILGYIEKLSELDTTDVEPMMHVLDLANVYREDVVGPSLDRTQALKNAPNTDGAYFLVPRILDAE